MAILQQTNTGQYLLTIPKKIVEGKKWHKGTKINIWITKNGLNIEEVETK